MSKKVKYVDVFKLAREHSRFFRSGDDRYIVMAIPMRAVLEAEEADVEPIKRGRWVPRPEMDDICYHYYRCSECGETVPVSTGDPATRYPYCHCGAKMDGKASKDLEEQK